MGTCLIQWILSATENDRIHCRSILQDGFHRGRSPSISRRSPTAFGTIWFIDDTTRQQHKEDWCYKLRWMKDADLKRTDLDPCNNLTYTSKEGGNRASSAEAF